jgi:hypothetical protein
VVRQSSLLSSISYSRPALPAAVRFTRRSGSRRPARAPPQPPRAGRTGRRTISPCRPPGHPESRAWRLPPSSSV